MRQRSVHGGIDVVPVRHSPHFVDVLRIGDHRDPTGAGASQRGEGRVNVTRLAAEE